jgi:hypothetical protein
MKCRACHHPYVRIRPMQIACSVLCAMQLVKEAKARAERKETRARREKIKTRAQWRKEAQTAFNSFIRLRDRHLPCVSCGRHHEGQYHAGHYLSTGARPELRFDEANCHKQCSACNTHLSGNLVLYRAELMNRIGPAEVQRLEGPQQVRKLTSEDLKAIRDEYRAMVRCMNRG